MKIALCFLMLCGIANTSSVFSSEATHQNHPQARNFIQDLLDRAKACVVSDIHQRNINFGQLLKGTFPMDAIAKSIIGSAWDAWMPEQKESCIQQISHSMANVFGNLVGDALKNPITITNIMLEQRNEKDLWKVQCTGINPRNNGEISIMFVLRRDAPGVIKVWDVQINGFSIKKAKVNEYKQMWRDCKGKPEAFFDQLKQLGERK